MMERYRQFKQLIVQDFETATWNHPIHNHNHFEIIYIAHGKGIHHLNTSYINYQTGDLYLLGPEDEHEFIIEETTRFIYMKFTHLYLNTSDVDSPSQWNKDVDYLLKNNNCKDGSLIQKKQDKATITSLMQLIVNEYQNDDVLSRKIIFQYFKALVLLLKRNQKCCGIKQNREETADITEELLEYIELNIYAPKQLSLKQIANHFHYSPNYMGVFFKDKVGMSLKNYIQQYRFTLLEQRLKHGYDSTKQLAIEFGFTDESHLHKFVKGYTGKTFTELKATR